MFLVDLVVVGRGMEKDGESDWSVHLLVFHMNILGLGHTHTHVHSFSEHCKVVLLNLLLVLADYGGHLFDNFNFTISTVMIAILSTLKIIICKFI